MLWATFWCLSPGRRAVAPGTSLAQHTKLLLAQAVSGSQDYPSTSDQGVSLASNLLKQQIGYAGCILSRMSPASCLSAKPWRTPELETSVSRARCPTVHPCRTKALRMRWWLQVPRAGMQTACMPHQGWHCSRSQAVCLAAEALASSTPASQSPAPARAGQETTLGVTRLAGRAEGATVTPCHTTALCRFLGAGAGSLCHRLTPPAQHAALGLEMVQWAHSTYLFLYEHIFFLSVNFFCLSSDY